MSKRKRVFEKTMVYAPEKEDPMKEEEDEKF